MLLRQVASAVVLLGSILSVQARGRGMNRFLNNYERNPYNLNEDKEDEVKSSVERPRQFKVTQIGDVTEVKFSQHKEKNNRGGGLGRRGPPKNVENDVDAVSSEEDRTERPRQREQQKPRLPSSITTTERPNYPENFPIKPNYPPMMVDLSTSKPSSPKPRRPPMKVMVKKTKVVTSTRTPGHIKYIDTSLPVKTEKAPLAEPSEPSKKFNPPQTFLQMRKKTRKQVQPTASSQDGNLAPSKDENLVSTRRPRPVSGPRFPSLRTKTNDAEENVPTKPTIVKPTIKFPQRKPDLPRKPPTSEYHDEIIQLAPFDESVFEEPIKNTFEMTDVIPMKVKPKEERKKQEFPTLLFHKSPRKVKTTSFPISQDQGASAIQEEVPEVEEFGSRVPGAMLSQDEKIIINHVMAAKPTSPPMKYRKQQVNPRPRKKPNVPFQDVQSTLSTPVESSSVFTPTRYYDDITTRRPRKRPTKSTPRPHFEEPQQNNYEENYEQENYKPASHKKPFDWNDYESSRDAWNSGPTIPSPISNDSPHRSQVYPTQPVHDFDYSIFTHEVPQHHTPVIQTPPATPPPPQQPGFQFEYSLGVDHQPGYVSYQIKTPRYQNHHYDNHNYDNDRDYHHNYRSQPKQRPSRDHWDNINTVTSSSTPVGSHELFPHKSNHQDNIHYRHDNHKYVATSHQSITFGPNSEPQSFVVHHRY